MASKIMSNKEIKKELQLLKDFLMGQDISERKYSIGEYCDDSICIEVDGDKWVVYTGDHSNRYGEKHFIEFNDAACNLLSSVANNHSEAEYLTKAFREYLEEFECIEIDIVETNKKYPFSFLFNHFFKRNINVSHNKTRVSFLRVYILIALIVMIISSLLTYHITVMITEHAVVNLMSGCFDTVEENYTLEESILEISFEMDELKNEINDLKKNIETKQKNYEKDNEIDQLKQELSKKTHELDKMEDRYNGLMKDFDLLQQKGYEEYVHDKQSKYPVAMDDIEIFKNKDIKIGETGDTSLHGEVFGYYVATNSLGEAYIEYNVEKSIVCSRGKRIFQNGLIKNMIITMNV